MSQILVTGEAKIRDIQGPVVANSGVITALDGAANQYVRGDGTLAIFPTSSGGGSSVSYYLNGSVNQGTFGGSTYYQMSRNAIVGTGTNFSTSSDGLIAQFITDANDPDVVSIPSGNWNVEFFMNVSASSGALASFYVEIYKYNGSTFTLLATNVATPEQLTNTTTVDAYFTSVAMPLSAMAVTDRLAVRIFANVASKTVTLYTEDNRLCQIVTTFSNGLTSLNNLTDQSQYLTTGTSGTNFNIVSSGDTHTFNLPVASATNTGKLSSTDWSTFNAKQPAGNYVTLDTTQTITAEKTFTQNLSLDGNGSNAGTLLLKNNTISPVAIGYASINSNGNNINLTAFVSATKTASFDLSGISDNIPRTFTFPNASGTLALTSNLSSYVPYTGATSAVNLGTNNLIAKNTLADGLLINQSGSGSVVAGYTTIRHQTGSGIFGFLIDNSNTGVSAQLLFNNATSYEYTFPTASGTIALTSNLSSYVPYTGATGSVNLGLNNLTANNVFGETSLNVKILPSGSVFSTGYSVLSSLAGKFTMAQEATAGNLKAFTFDFSAWATNTSRTYSLPDITGTLALLEGTQTFTGDKLFNGSVDFNNSVNINSGLFIRNNVIGSTLYTSFTITKASSTQTLSYLFSTGFASNLLFNDAANYSYTFPTASGTIALTSNLSAYLPLTGGTLTGALSGTSATFTANTNGVVLNAATGTTNTQFKVANTSGDNYFGVAASDGSSLFTGTTAYSAYLGTNNARSLHLVTNGIVRQTIDSTGAATFSSTLTSNDLTIKNSANAETLDLFLSPSTSNGFIDYPSGRSLTIRNKGSLGITTFTSSGNVGIGTSSPSVRLEVGGASNADSTGRFFKTAEGTLLLGGNRSTSNCPFIGSENNYDFAFITNNSEKMRITSGGVVCVGGINENPAANGTNGIALTNSFLVSINRNNDFGLDIGRNGTDGAVASFRRGSTQVGTISVTGSATAYNTSSDYRLKQDLKDFNGLSLVSAIKTYDYEWKSDETRAFGVIAHELAEVLPYAVVGEKDGEDMQGVDYSKLVPVLVKGLQEEDAKVNAQDLRIQQLEIQIEELKALIAAK